MARKFVTACFLGIFWVSIAAASDLQAQDDSSRVRSSAQQQQQIPDESDPPEEDEAAKPKTYSFDPLEAERNIKVGQFYMRQHSDRGYRAAAGRFEDATKYNPKNAEAFFLLGTAEEKLRHKDRAEAAFRKVVELSPGTKLAKEAERKLVRAG